MAEAAGQGHWGGDAAWPAPTPAGFPPDFVPLSGGLPVGIDRRLGYVGEARFVTFRYERRAEEVVWDDGHTYGFGAGGWCVFLDRIAPLAERHGVDLGGGTSAGGHVLVLDRASGSAWFADRDSAATFLASLASLGGGHDRRHG